MIVGILILFLLPLAVRAALYAGIDRPASFDDADCSSVGMLPPADADRDAPRILVTSASASCPTHEGLFVRVPHATLQMFERTCADSGAKRTWPQRRRGLSLCESNVRPV
ncbi:MAG TPA: hypothetical protein VKG24_22815 [Pseudolabrys sp.]|nr:hypothetical protein [Pseudolabrys sp.]